jgi:hypothetical protein
MRCYCWIQIHIHEQEQFDQQGMLAAGSGYHYNDATTWEEMVEFHVDVRDDFQTRMNGMTGFGRCLSVRKDPDKKPLIKIGQDGCIGLIQQRARKITHSRARKAVMATPSRTPVWITL